MASWNHLIKSLRQPSVNLSELASKIELMIPQLGNQLVTICMYTHSKLKRSLLIAHIEFLLCVFLSKL